MKRLLALAVCLTAIVHISNAQEKTKPHPAAPLKGYYAIGRNAQKLAIRYNETSRVPDPYIYNDKGYYSLKNNRNRIPWRSTIEPVNVQQFQGIRKGYYSIGDNARKLGN